MTVAPRPPRADLSRAVLIGTSDYRHGDRLSALPSVRNNLVDLLDALTAPGTGILTRQQCTTIDSPDSPDSFLERLHAVAGQAQDLLVVYYAGHGILHETRDDVLYLAVRQTDPMRPAGNAVPFGWVREAIEHGSARTKLLILDCCYSGAAIGAMAGGTVDQRDIEVSGTCVITSSPWNKTSLSPPGERYTAFTGELIRLLRHGSPIDGEPLTVPALYRGLRAALANRQLPLPKMQATDTSVDLLLRRAPDAEPAHAEPDPTPPSNPEPGEKPSGSRIPGIGTPTQRRWLILVLRTLFWPIPMLLPLVLLWPNAFLGFGSIVGGLIGAAAGTNEDLIQRDLSLAASGAVAVTVSGVLLIVYYVWRARRSASRPTPQRRWSGRLVTGLRVAMLVFLLTMTVVAAMGGARMSYFDNVSPLANRVATTTAFGAALAYATVLFRRRTR